MLKTTLAAIVITLIVSVGMISVIHDSQGRSRNSTQYVLEEIKIVSNEGVTLQGKSAEDCKDHDNDIVLTISKSGNVDLNKMNVDPSQLDMVLEEVYRERRCKIIFVDGDPNLPWKDVVSVVDSARGLGIVVNIMTEKLKEELGYQPKLPRPEP